MGEGITEEQKNKGQKIVIGIIISLCILLIVYVGMSIYFLNHFYFGSTIDCVSISGKTVKEAEKEMSSRLMNYTLKLKERGGRTEQIKAADIDMKYTSYKDVQSLKEKQHPFAWISAIFNAEDFKTKQKISYDEELLEDQINKLSCLDSRFVTEPKNPGFAYVSGKYVVLKEQAGNKIDKDILYNKVADAIVKGENTVDLEAACCYIKPQYTANSPEVIEAKNTLNKYVSSKTTYVLGKRNEIVDGSVINKWLEVNNNYDIILDEKKAEAYLSSIFSRYDTVGKERTFNTSSGKSILISGGDYGWMINASKEAQDLVAVIRQGQTILKEPQYSQTALANDNNDIGNTYVEIDITKQHLWYYKNGSLIVQGDVVTGNVSNSHSTPAGIYRLKCKQKNAVLRGPGYSCPVEFWMPFNGGIGLHDASWRSEFGGEIYKTNGSHGCINAPYYVAETVFKNIEEGTPIICYY